MGFQGARSSGALRFSAIRGSAAGLGAGARSPVTLRDGRVFRARSARPRRWPGGCDGRDRSERKRNLEAQREHAMMIAFVMAVAGIAVLGTLNLVAAR